MPMYQVAIGIGQVLAIFLLKSIGIGSALENWHQCITTIIIVKYVQVKPTLTRTKSKPNDLDNPDNPDDLSHSRWFPLFLCGLLSYVNFFDYWFADPVQGLCLGAVPVFFTFLVVSLGYSCFLLCALCYLNPSCFWLSIFNDKYSVIIFLFCTEYSSFLRAEYLSLF